MRQITITIATRNRLEKLRRCLESIPQRPDVQVLVCCDADPDTFQKIHSPVISALLYQPKHSGSPACHNRMAAYATDGLLYLMDDMTLFPDTIDKALEDYNREFPGDDGMMGILQDGVDGGKSGVALLGRKFLARFPGNQFCYPGYWHFSDMETLALAEKLGKFYFSNRARVIHYHPDGFQGVKDQTHFDGRIRKEEDFALFKLRQEAGLIWGMEYGNAGPG